MKKRIIGVLLGCVLCLGSTFSLCPAVGSAADDYDVTMDPNYMFTTATTEDWEMSGTATSLYMDFKPYLDSYDDLGYDYLGYADVTVSCGEDTFSYYLYNGETSFFLSGLVEDHTYRVEVDP